MALEVGNIVEGKVTGLAKFGVFVELGDKKVGLVHISEVASEYVSDVNDYLKINDKVKVKILSVYYKRKIPLSIKQVSSGDLQEKKREHFKKDHYTDNNFGRNDNNHDSFGEKDSKHFYSSKNTGFRSVNKSNTTSFEDKLSRFLKDSDERLLDLKRNVESKRGGRGAKRSD